ncbi:histone parylation factor 1 [Plakobranchus ocellatus]|uniref:Histone parylation factor 1 n=1 Tax=Plakobranchus ocellatus TaxID=259542 RepID=A0AAV3Y0Z3_9GAST|nr:histone parylation factor 1 [Plakobranchus ocellatus]
MAAVVKTKTKPACKYGSKCYRRNAQHLRDYSHPEAEKQDDNSGNAMAKANSDVESNTTGKQKRTIQDFFSPSHKNTEAASKQEETPPTKKPKTSTETSPQGEGELAKGGTRESPSQEEQDESLEQEEDAEKEAPVYPDDVRQCIKETFLVEMPEDFYQFWDFCQGCNKLDPSSALRKSLGLRLGGPFDILSGRHKKVLKNKRGKYPNFLLHHRFYYDPPEFQTVLIADDDSKFHIGYFRDDPSEMPVFLASNSPGPTSSSKGKIFQYGDNIFAAVHTYATLKVKSEKGDKKKLMEQVIQSIEREAKKLQLSLERVTKSMKKREKKVNCPTFHEAGMVVPVDANDVGYRPVPESPRRIAVGTLLHASD